MKARSNFKCAECGYESAKWMGRCAGCGAWNSMQEQTVSPAPVASMGTKKVRMAATGRKASPTTLSQVTFADEVRFVTGVDELDRVLGGGVVKGSLVLLGGDPGIGKSTLLLQICEFLGQNLKILYVSGEESVRQIKLRADRLQVSSENLLLLAETDVETIANTIVAEQPDLVMIDSIQTMSVDAVQSSPGSVTQVKESTNAFLHLAKSEDVPIFVVGHVTKDGAIAGPKVLEHIVDAVLHFEGDRNQSYRILRAVKNRFGSTNEIGVFEMMDVGLKEVKNPSQMLLADRPVNTSGTCVACIMEGSRPMLAEVQTLVSKSAFVTPRRTATGVDYNRMAMLLAVLEKRCGYHFSSLDAYVNVIGGLRLDEPAADLPIALAFVSGLLDKPIPDDLIAFGEVGLAGEVRTVHQIESRISEAERLGFTRCIIPKQCMRQLQPKKRTIEIIGVSTVQQAVQTVGRIAQE